MCLETVIDLSLRLGLGRALHDSPGGLDGEQTVAMF